MIIKLAQPVYAWKIVSVRVLGVQLFPVDAQIVTVQIEYDDGTLENDQIPLSGAAADSIQKALAALVTARFGIEGSTTDFTT